MSDVEKFRDIFDEVHLFTEKHIEVGKIGDRLKDFIKDFFDRKENEIKKHESVCSKLHDEYEELYNKYNDLIQKFKENEQKTKFLVANSLKIDDIKELKF